MSDKLTAESIGAAINVLEENKVPGPVHIFFEEKMLPDICELLGVEPNLDVNGEQKVENLIIKVWNCETGYGQ